MSKKVKEQPAIRLKHFYVKHFSISNNTGKTSISKLDISVNQGLVQNENPESTVIIVFDVSLENKKEEFRLDCLAEFVFETNIKISKEFLDSPFIAQSAPAIAFPYVRSMICLLYTSDAADE